MFCKLSLDTQKHALSCHTIVDNKNKELLPAINSGKYNDIFSDVQSQDDVTKVYQNIIQVREKLREHSLHPAYPGNSTGYGG